MIKLTVTLSGDYPAHDLGNLSAKIADLVTRGITGVIRLKCPNIKGKIEIIKGSQTDEQADER